jgi:hypothetical protein
MSDAELEKIEANRSGLTQDAGYGAWRQLLGHRETLLLACAYFTHNFVFYSFATWFFHYLVNVLGFQHYRVRHAGRCTVATGCSSSDSRRLGL